eukprot:gene6531-6603_t
MVTAQDDSKLDDLLAQYAAGHLPPALHVLVASHLILKPQNRQFVGSLEALNAFGIEEAAPQPLRNRQAMLDQIFASPAPEPKKLSSPSPFPEPLSHFIGRDLDNIQWHRMLPGIRDYRVEDKNGCEANLYWIKAGHRIPSHTHEGSEFTLVLRGAFSDQSGLFKQGDIAIADAEVDHRPVASMDEDCLCYAVTDARLRLTGPFGRVIDRFFKH